MRTIIIVCTVAFPFYFSEADLAHAQEVETYDSGTYSEIFEPNPPAVFSIINGQGLNGTRGIQPLNTPYTINYLRKGPFDLSIPGATLEITTFFKVAKPTSTNLGVATLELGFAQDQTPTSFIAPYQTGTISWWLEPKSLIATGAGFQFDTMVHVSVYNGSSSAGFSWAVSGNTILNSNNWYKATLQVSPVNSTTLRLWGFIDDYGTAGQSYIGRVDTVGTDNANGNTSYPFTPFTTDSSMYPALHGMSSGGLSVVDQTAIDVTLPGGGFGPRWTQTTAPASSNWNSVASSSDGSKLVAVILDGGIYTSTNFGGTWTRTSAPVEAWWSVASSSNGSNLVAASRPGGIWASTNSGLNWSQTTAPSGYPPFWNSVACSGDGSHLVAAQDCACYPSVPSGGVWTSTNFGATWSKATAPNTNTDVFVTLSADSRHLFAASFFDTSGIYTSTDFGATWTLTSAPTTYWSGIATSADGSHLVAAAFDIYTSRDFGATWTRTSAPSISNWAGVASSADGGRLIGAQFSFGISTSTDSGSTWSSNNVPSGSWRSVASSADGSHLVAVQEPGGIYTSIVPTVEYEFQADFDGRDWLVIQGQTARWQHFDFTPVGQHNPSYPATVISSSVNGVALVSGVSWIPSWPNGTGYGAWSSTYGGLIPALPPNPAWVGLNVVSGRGSVSIVQLPNAANTNTLIVEFNDDAISGDALYDVQVYVATESPLFLPPQQRTGRFVLTWSAAPGQAYQVQYKDVLTQTSWLNLGNPITASNATAVWFDATTNQARFYRVRLYP